MPIDSSTTRVCQHCGGSFHAKPSQVKAGHALFCSKVCMIQAKASPERICPHCGSSFKSKSRRRQWCSLACSYAARTVPLAERFWAKVDRSGGADACWMWTAYRTPHGYGRIGTGHTTKETASRLAWVLTNGPIPDGLYVCHNCPGGDNPACCNPRHFFLGTHQDNVADATVKGLVARGERCPHAKLTAVDIPKIRQQVASGVVQRRVAAEFGVSPTVICNIVKGKTWRHVA